MLKIVPIKIQHINQLILLENVFEKLFVAVYFMNVKKSFIN
jgi:hypothetical protein